MIMICDICGKPIKNLAKHIGRRRCKMQGREGIKAGIPFGTKDRSKLKYDMVQK
jgi:hypothetical protein